MNDSKEQFSTETIGDEAVATDETAAAAKQAIQRHATRIKEKELDEAYNRLAHDSELSATEREVLDAMATAIVAEIVAAPVSVLDNTAAYDAETVETALDLFDPTE